MIVSIHRSRLPTLLPTNPMSSSSSSPSSSHSAANAAANTAAVTESAPSSQSSPPLPLETRRLPDGDDPSVPPGRDSGDDLLVVIDDDPSVMTTQSPAGEEDCIVAARSMPSLTVLRLDFRRGSSGGMSTSSREFFVRLGPGAVISSTMANLAASMPELAKIPAVRLRLAWT